MRAPREHQGVIMADHPSGRVMSPIFLKYKQQKPSIGLLPRWFCGGMDEARAVVEIEICFAVFADMGVLQTLR